MILLFFTCQIKFSLLELFLYHFELLLLQNAEAVARKCSRK